MAEGVGKMRGFGIVLSSRVFVEVIEAAIETIVVSVARSERLRRAVTYVRPRCDETHLSRHSPISSNFSDDSGFRHSFSRSYCRSHS